MKNLILLTLAAIPALALTQPVKTHDGMISGVPGKDTSIIAFKGIPYAAPPVGNLRWQAPKPPAPWQGVRKADAFSASCIQNITGERAGQPWTREFMAAGPLSEDCL